MAESPELIPRVDALMKWCSEENGCPVLPLVRDKIMAGEWGDALRYLKQPGSCGHTVVQCSTDGEALRDALFTEEKGRLQILWKEAFGEKPLEIDFVCGSPLKLRAIKEAMKLVDVIPLTFTLMEHPSGRYDVVRFTVEL